VNFEVTLLRAVEESRTRAIDSLIKELSAIAMDAPEASGQKKNS
jgi:DNA polymerase III subunit gamma/tau